MLPLWPASTASSSAAARATCRRGWPDAALARSWGSTTRPPSWPRPDACATRTASPSRSSTATPSRCPPIGGFDLAVSEYGAAIWCDPYRWIPEAARLLRPGGRLAFLGNATLLMLFVDEDGVPAHTAAAAPAGHAPLRVDRGRTPSVEFHVSHGDRIRLLRESGFEVLDLVELYPPEGATTSYPYVTPRVGPAVAERGGVDRPPSADRPARTWSIAEIRELEEGDAEIALLQLGDHRLQVIALLAVHRS